jgi:queuosine precursor transporter
MGEIMFNLFFGLTFILINLVLLLTFYKLFGKTGLFIWIAIATIIANIQVNKSIEIFGLTATLGNTIYGSIFLATDILNEKYGAKDANRSVVFGFSSAVIMLVTMSLSLLFIPSVNDYAHDSLMIIFNPALRIVAGSLMAYLISQFLDIKIYNIIKSILPSYKFLWVRNNVSTILSQVLDSTIFVLVAFLFVYEVSILFEIFITTIVFKVIIALIDTPFLYVAKRIKPNSN